MATIVGPAVLRRASLVAAAVLVAAALDAGTGAGRPTPAHARVQASRAARPAPGPASPVPGPASPVPGPASPVPGPPPALPLGQVIDHGPRDRPRVALTFDADLTTAMSRELDRGQVASFDNVAVIDELDALDVPATFFLTGMWMQRYPDTTRRLGADPRFELGNHSYEHRAFHTPCYGLGALAPDRMVADIRRTGEVLARLTGHPTSLFRFPGLCQDAAALRAAAEAGVTVVGADVTSGDAFGRSVGAIVAQVLGSVQNGSIVVMHVTGGNTAPLTARALGPVVAGLRSRGFELVRVSDLLGVAPPEAVRRGKIGKLVTWRH